jgi:alpha-1,3-mannosyltransferase
MQQIEQFLGGERDYAMIKGSTGPLWYSYYVYRDNGSYPAGHVWIYTALYKITSKGHDIFAAQVVFMVIYLITLAITLSVYKSAKVEP